MTRHEAIAGAVREAYRLGIRDERVRGERIARTAAIAHAKDYGPGFVSAKALDIVADAIAKETP